MKSTVCSNDPWVEGTGKPAYDTLVEMVRALQKAPTDEQHDKALRDVWNSATGVRVRTGWYVPRTIKKEPVQAEEYNILVSVGNSETRVIGTLNKDNEPESARLEVLDFDKVWTVYPETCEATLLFYARQFYFGG